MLLMSLQFRDRTRFMCDKNETYKNDNITFISKSEKMHHRTNTRRLNFISFKDHSIAMTHNLYCLYVYRKVTNCDIVL